MKLEIFSFKIKRLLIIKDTEPRSLRSKVVYRFICAICNSTYVGVTNKPISVYTSGEQLYKDKIYSTFKHLNI